MREDFKNYFPIIQQSIKEYQVLFLYRPEDRVYWDNKRSEGLMHCYIKDNGELIPWNGENILRSFNNVTLNVQDDTFDSKRKKMRVAKRAPNYWNLYFTSERIIATIPYGKTLKVGDIVDLFKTSMKRISHKGHYVISQLPHSMLAGVVLRIQDDKSQCKHIALVYKNKLKSPERIVNYTLYYFNYGTLKQAEKFGMEIRNLACKLQLKLLPFLKETQLLTNTEIMKIQKEVSNNLKKTDYEITTSKEKFKSYTIKTLYVGGIPLPIYPRTTCNKSELLRTSADKYHRSR